MAQLERTFRPELKKALDIFIHELASHINGIRESLHMLSHTGAGNERRTLEHRFHTIKGGAGFFQFGAIKDCAARGEKMMQNKEQASEEAFFTELERLVETLDTQATEIRTVFGVDEDTESNFI